jgi:hypothetical protein
LFSSPQSALFRPDSFTSVKIPFVKSEPMNSLSGLPGGDGPILVVKLDDTRSAHPQIGIEEADIVYIEQVEGGLTRLAAVFSSKIPQRIGPVRSARISDIELLGTVWSSWICLQWCAEQVKTSPRVSKSY